MATTPPDFLAARDAARRLYPTDVAAVLGRAFAAAHERVVEHGEPLWYEHNAPVSRAAREVLAAEGPLRGETSSADEETHHG